MGHYDTRVVKVGPGLDQIFHAKVSFDSYVYLHKFASTGSLK